MMLIKWQNFWVDLLSNKKQICHRPSKRGRQDKILQNVPYYADFTCFWPELSYREVEKLQVWKHVSTFVSVTPPDIFKADLGTISGCL